MKTKKALKGLKIVDFSWVFTGPIVTRYLGDHGAEVIRIESATRPDGTRFMTPLKPGVDSMSASGVFANFNAGKYSITVNLNEPRGKEIAKKLVQRADIVLETFAPGVMTKLQLDYDVLKQVKPDIIMLSMSMVGQTGPYCRQPSYGQTLQATGGFVNLLGWPDRSPSLPASPYADYIAPWYVLITLLAALDFRRRTGKGQYVDLSMLESSVHFIAPAVLDYTVNGRIQNRRSNRNSGYAPHGVYPCRGQEQWIAIAVATEEEWRALCNIMDNPDWTKSPEFDVLAHRLENQDELDRLMALWTADYRAEELMIKLQAAGVAAGVLKNAEELVDKDPQLKQRQHFVELDHHEMGKHLVERPPFHLSKTPAEPQRPFPSFGEHTEYICKEILKMDDAEFAKLIGDGVLE